MPRLAQTTKFRRFLTLFRNQLSTHKKALLVQRLVCFCMSMEPNVRRLPCHLCQGRQDSKRIRTTGCTLHYPLAPKAAWVSRWSDACNSMDIFPDTRLALRHLKALETSYLWSALESLVCLHEDMLFFKIEPASKPGPREYLRSLYSEGILPPDLHFRYPKTWAYMGCNLVETAQALTVKEVIQGYPGGVSAYKLTCAALTEWQEVQRKRRTVPKVPTGDRHTRLIEGGRI